MTASATLSYILALLTFPAAPPVHTHCLNALTNLFPHFMIHSNTHVILHLCLLMFHVIMYHPIAIMSLLLISEAERTEETRAKGEDGGCFRAGAVLIFTFVFLSFSFLSFHCNHFTWSKYRTTSPDASYPFTHLAGTLSELPYPAHTCCASASHFAIHLHSTLCSI